MDYKSLGSSGGRLVPGRDAAGAARRSNVGI